MPGDPFGDPGHLRFNFAVRPETLEEGVRRMVERFGG
jgi:aspartate/methionine/tyrosine aminotransferase